GRVLNTIGRWPRAKRPNARSWTTISVPLRSTIDVLVISTVNDVIRAPLRIAAPDNVPMGANVRRGGSAGSKCRVPPVDGRAFRNRDRPAITPRATTGSVRAGDIRPKTRPFQLDRARLELRFGVVGILWPRPISGPAPFPRD